MEETGFNGGFLALDHYLGYQSGRSSRLGHHDVSLACPLLSVGERRHWSESLLRVAYPTYGWAISGWSERSPKGERAV